MTTSCYFCKGRVIEEVTRVNFWWGDDLKIIENVPANVCQQCGEQYIKANVYKDIERLAQEPRHAVRRLSIDVMRYSAA